MEGDRKPYVVPFKGLFLYPQKYFVRTNFKFIIYMSEHKCYNNLEK